MAHHARAVSANRLFALAAVLLTLVFVLMVSRVFDTPARTAVREEAVVATPAYEAARTATTLDTDTDGMPDWEETLLGTDLNNSDENANGVIDGDERDQLIKQPQASKLAYASSTTPPVTLTDALAQELLGTYMGAIKDGDEIDATIGDEILNKAFASRGDFSTPSKPRAHRDMLQVVESTTSTHEQYARDVMALLEKVSNSFSGEYAAMGLIVNGDIETGIAQFQKSSQGYESLADSLEKISVPTDAVPVHLTLIDALNAYSTTLAHLGALQKDPVFAATGYASLSTTQAALYGAFSAWAQQVSTGTNTTVPQGSGGSNTDE